VGAAQSELSSAAKAADRSLTLTAEDARQQEQAAKSAHTSEEYNSREATLKRMQAGDYANARSEHRPAAVHPRGPGEPNPKKPRLGEPKATGQPGWGTSFRSSQKGKGKATPMASVMAARAMLVAKEQRGIDMREEQLANEGATLHNLGRDSMPGPAGVPTQQPGPQEPPEPLAHTGQHGANPGATGGAAAARPAGLLASVLTRNHRIASSRGPFRG